MFLPYHQKKRLPDQLGRKLISARGDLGVSQRSLAELARVSPLAVQALETGPECFAALQRVLGVLDRELIVTKDTIELKKRSECH